MKLYVTFTSPYARLARIMVLEKALADPHRASSDVGEAGRPDNRTMGVPGVPLCVG